MVKRKICVVTGTRAEYGLLRYLMEAIRDSADLELQLVVTGMHVSPEFGLTYREIKADGFQIDRKVEMLLSSDSGVGTAKATGLATVGFADAFSQLSPDVLVLLGDRFEMLAAATTALLLKMPIAHLHGGEITEGAFDEGIRHAITKMSHLHFVATEEYRRRVLQLGESNSSVFLVGGLGVDAIKRTKLLDRDELKQLLGIQFGAMNFLITWHPTTLDELEPTAQWREIEALLDEYPEAHCFFTKPNADPGNYGIALQIDNYVRRNQSRCFGFTSLGCQRYWSLMAQVDAVAGNSSSGLLEAPSLKVGTINIGDRQRGRVLADSVINCKPELTSLRSAFEKCLSNNFQEKLKTVQNPYGNGGAAQQIKDILGSTDWDRYIVKKRFHDR